MEKRENTEYPILDVLGKRWSPRAFDPLAVVTAADLAPAFEAARWAPSGNNLQPWSFIVGYRGDEKFNKILENLSGFNQVWTPNASALVVAITNTGTPSGRPNPWARYDLGQAVAHFTIQATAEGLATHQLGGIDIEALTAELGVNEPWEIVTVIVVGKIGDPETLPAERKETELAPRQRKPLSEIVSL